MTVMDRDFKDISSLIPLDDVAVQSFVSNRMQVADIIEWIGKQFGKMSLRISTFSVAEEFLRRLFFMKKSIDLTSVSVIVDFKATNKTLKLWPFMCRVFDRVVMADNHSKVILAEAEDGRCCAVVTSQNLTRGNRFESSIIVSDRSVFKDLAGDFDFIVESSSVPLNEILSERFGSD